jgi:hypothetical protein
VIFCLALPFWPLLPGVVTPDRVSQSWGVLRALKRSRVVRGFVTLPGVSFQRYQFFAPMDAMEVIARLLLGVVVLAAFCSGMPR